MNRIIISGGGTGGHIYPALAIADTLRQRSPEIHILFIGAYGKMEMEKVPDAGYPIRGLWIDGLHRKHFFRNILFPVKLIVSVLHSFFYFILYRPQFVIGTGGFASGPMVFVASLLGIPSLIQEQNSFPGITNRLLGRIVKRIAVCYAGMERFFPKNKLIVTGNPTRKELRTNLIESQKAKSFFELVPDKKTLVILGGSLGALKINELIAQKLTYFNSQGWQVIWQCGKLYYSEYQSKGSPSNKIYPFINRMDQLYAAADLIISRAGASTIAELAQVGKPVLFIPSPNVAEDHQMKNARALESLNAARVLAEKDLKHHFDTVFESLSTDSDLMRILGQNIRNMARPNAVEEIVDEIETLASV